MQYARALKEKGVEVKVIMFPNDVHSIERYITIIPPFFCSFEFPVTFTKLVDYNISLLQATIWFWKLT